MGGNRKDFWDLWKKEKVGLITFEESEVDQIEGIGEKDIARASYPSINLTDNSSLLVNLSDVGFHTNISRLEKMKFPVLENFFTYIGPFSLMHTPYAKRAYLLLRNTS